MYLIDTLKQNFLDLKLYKLKALGKTSDLPVDLIKGIDCGKRSLDAIKYLEFEFSLLSCFSTEFRNSQTF